MGLFQLARISRQRLRSLWDGGQRSDELSRWRVIATKVRWFAAYRYIRGSGIEIGGLHHPLQTYHRARVQYVDRLSTAELRLAYPELADQKLVEVNHVEDSETLASIADQSCDFVIANHVIEHTRNPIGAIENMFRVLKPNGILYMALPDKRFTFDAERRVTSYEHLRRDYLESPGWSDAEHYREWATRVSKSTSESEANRRGSELQAAQANIHFHVWTQREMIELLLNLRRDFRFPIEIEAIMKNSKELVVVLRKADRARCYCLLRRRKRYAPMTMKSTFGNQTSSSGWILALARMVSAMMMKRK
jgi:SAM-dependent methyltransferase